MSEELRQTTPQKIGKYTYYRLGSTTLNQLKIAGIIPMKNYGDLEAKRPDGLVLYQGRVRAVVEYKQPGELRTDSDLARAIRQEREVAQALCKALSLKHLDRYIAEFEGRHNRRPLDTAVQMATMARGADGKRLRYQDLVAA